MAGNKPSETRRKVLQALAGTGLVSAGVGSVSAFSTKGGDQVIRYGSLDEPLTTDAVVDLQEDALHQHGLSGAERGRVVVKPEINDGRKIVSYAHYFDENGAMNSFFGYARPDSYYTSENIKFEATEEITSEREEEIKKMSAERRLEQRSAESEVQTQHDEAESFLVTSDYDSPRHFSSDSMNFVRGVEDDIGECPEGKVQGRWELFQGNGDDTNIWSVGSHQRVLPGVNECNSNWENYELDIHHDYSNAPNGPTVESHKPNGERTGSYQTDYTITYGAPSVGFSYEQPDVSRGDDSGSDDVDLDWSWNNDYRGSPIKRAAGMVVFDTTPTCGDQLLVGRQWAKFRDLVCFTTCGWVYEEFDTNYGFIKCPGQLP